MYKMIFMNFQIIINKVYFRKSNIYINNFINLLTGADTHKHEYHQLYIRSHKVTGSQMSAYYTCGYPL